MNITIYPNRAEDNKATALILVGFLRSTPKLQQEWTDGLIKEIRVSIDTLCMPLILIQYKNGTHQSYHVAGFNDYQLLTPSKVQL